MSDDLVKHKMRVTVALDYQSIEGYGTGTEFTISFTEPVPPNVDPIKYLQERIRNNIARVAEFRGLRPHLGDESIAPIDNDDIPF